GKPELLSTFQYIYGALGIKSEEELPYRKEPLLV
ncbi:type I methionyl aminopeptidase, partial [Flavobacteriaceae bacterium]|nr:type I methionyl aminopeptidase [Flavobacteriaceae bacterium]